MAVRMRNIKQAYLYIKEQDSETALTESAFRSIVKKGLIPTVLIGKRVLLKLDDVDDFLENVTGVVLEKVRDDNDNANEKIRKQEINVQAL